MVRHNVDQKIYRWKFFIPKTIAKPSVNSFFLATASGRDAYTIGLFFPSMSLCDRTAPTPYGEV